MRIRTRRSRGTSRRVAEKYDEIYQPKNWDRNKVHVLLSLDPTKLNYTNNRNEHREDHDFDVAWTKMCWWWGASSIRRWGVNEEAGRS